VEGGLDGRGEVDQAEFDRARGVARGDSGAVGARGGDVDGRLGGGAPAGWGKGVAEHVAGVGDGGAGGAGGVSDGGDESEC